MIVRFCYAVYLQLLNQHNQEFRPYIPDPLSRGAREGLGTRLAIAAIGVGGARIRNLVRAGVLWYFPYACGEKFLNRVRDRNVAIENFDLSRELTPSALPESRLSETPAQRCGELLA